MHIEFGYGCYDGDVDYNQYPHGKGKITYYKPDTQIPDTSVEAEFVNGVLTGDATVKFSDGETYVGGYNKDEGWRIGYGVMTYINGDKYEGEWHENNKSGKGTYTFANGSKYIGNWLNGFMFGYGEYFFKNGNIYKGNFLNDCFSGKGTLYYANGDKYEGDFVEDKATGKGTLTYVDGKKYVGEFLNDQITGTGTVFDANGEILYTGKWNNGNFVE